MSSSRSVDSGEDMITSGVSTDVPGSPSSTSQQNRSSSPCLDSIAGVGVAPKNPFDSIADIPTIPPLSHSGSGTDNSQLQNATTNTNNIASTIGMEPIDTVLGVNSCEQQPASPDRSAVVRPSTPSFECTPNSHQAQLHDSINMDTLDQSMSSGLVPTTPTIPQQLLLPQGLPPHTIEQPQFGLLEHRVHASPHLHHGSGAPISVFLSSDEQNRMNFDDDENTEPSSAANTADHMGQSQEPRFNRNTNQQSTSENVGGSILRFIHDTRRRIGTKERRKDSDGENLQDGALICGYLQKYGRNGKWQTRWFETDGECLSYYKSSKRTKLLATLDLEKVGIIEVDPEDNRECSFTIQVLGRMYHLRADSRAACKDWVITLNRVKEARLQQGNVKLLNRTIDLLDSHTDEVTPRVVVVSNRQRTRAVDEAGQWDKLYQAPTDPIDLEEKRLSALGNAVVARWTKRNTSLRRLGAKIAVWARSVKKYGCLEVDENNVVLDRHVHPPGHDDKGKHLSVGKPTTNKPASLWIAKEANNPALAMSRPDAIELSVVSGNPSACKPVRSLSATSEDYRTIS